jgi:hypothetical protein
MKKLIIEHGEQNYIDMSAKEEEQRLAEILQAEQDEQIIQEKEQAQKMAIDRLRQVSDTNIVDMLIALGLD